MSTRTSVPALVCVLGVGAILGSGTLPGCVRQQESLIVLGAAVWETDGEQCFLSAETTTFLSHGILDVAFETPYKVGVVLYNRLGNKNPMSSSSGLDDSEMQLESVDVDLEISQDTELLAALEQRDETLVHFGEALAADSIPGGGKVIGFVDAIPQRTSAALHQELVARYGSNPNTTIQVDAHMVFHARRTGNESKVGYIDSRWFSFPVEICIGCLVDCRDCENGVCPINPPSYSGGVCGRAQDAAMIPYGCEEMM